MENDSFDNLMHFLSRIVLIIPLVVILIGSVIFATNKIKALKGGSAEQKKLIPTVSLSKSSASTVKIDLKGPFVCDYSSKDATVSAYIKNRNLFVNRSEKDMVSSYLFDGDCFFSWDSNKGKKKCGLSSQVLMAENLLSLNILSLDSLMEMVSKYTGGEVSSSEGKFFEELLKTCRKKAIDDKIFRLPQNVVFMP